MRPAAAKGDHGRTCLLALPGIAVKLSRDICHDSLTQKQTIKDYKRGTDAGVYNLMLPADLPAQQSIDTTRLHVCRVHALDSFTHTAHGAWILPFQTHALPAAGTRAPPQELSHTVGKTVVAHLPPLVALQIA
jgi:hypothetical protein